MVKCVRYIDQHGKCSEKLVSEEACMPLYIEGLFKQLAYMYSLIREIIASSYYKQFI